MSRAVLSMKEKAEQAYGTRINPWILALAVSADERGVKTTAEAIGYSPSLVSSIVNDSYNGNPKHVERAVRGALMRSTVICPVLGEISGERCTAAQRRKLTPTNPMAVRLFKACRSDCPHSSIKADT